MKKYYFLLGLVALVALLFLFFLRGGINNEQIACTADALLCPDGTGVGRTGPNCEFSACPDQAFFEGEVRQHGSDFILATEAPEGSVGEITYSLPLNFSRISNVIGGLLGKEVRVTGKFKAGNLLEVESIEELDGANLGALRIGETEFISGVRITLNKIVEDSRCPVDVMCVWAGRLIANVTLRSDTDTETLDLESDKLYNFDVFKISIESVVPKPLSTESTASRNYILTFRVEK